MENTRLINLHKIDIMDFDDADIKNINNQLRVNFNALISVLCTNLIFNDNIQSKKKIEEFLSFDVWIDRKKQVDYMSSENKVIVCGNIYGNELYMHMFVENNVGDKCCNMFLNAVCDPLWNIFSVRASYYIRKYKIMKDWDIGEDDIRDISRDIITIAYKKIEHHIYNELKIEISSLIDLSYMTYEKRNVSDSYIFFYAPDRNNGIRIDIKYKEPMDFKELKIVRKLVESLNTDKENKTSLSLLVNVDTAKCVGYTFKKMGRHYTMHIYGTGRWELLYNGKLCFIYDKGKFRLFQTAPEDAIMSGVPPKLTTLIKEVRKIAKHGALFVVYNDKNLMYRELERFETRSMGIRFDKPVALLNAVGLLEMNMIKSFSCIDGAFIVDEDANCYGIGFILDSSFDSDYSYNRGRGSRYNSTNNYLESLHKTEEFCKNSVYAIVFSEDGGIDMPGFL